MFNFSNKNKLEKSELWKKFQGRGNSEKILQEKAEILALVLVDWCDTSVIKLIEHFEKDPENKNIKEKSTELSIESIILYMHFIDRLALKSLKNEKRDFFMNILVNRIIDIFSKNQPNQEEKRGFSSVIENIYEERQIEYSGYNLTPVENEGLKNTLFWEFEKKITKILGFEDNIVTMMEIQIYLVTGLKFLQLPEMFN